MAAAQPDVDRTHRGGRHLLGGAKAHPGLGGHPQRRSAARWGLGISLFFGVNYSAYLASNLLAVRGQAQQSADEFLQQLKKGDLIQAFILTLQPSARPGPGFDPRQIIELQHNLSPTPREPGSFTRFCRSDLVRLILLGGPETKLELDGVNADLEQEGRYRVTLRYKTTTPQGSFETLIMAVSQKPTSKGGRLWHIDLAGTGVGKHLEMTSAGAALDAVNGPATDFARRWTAKLKHGALDNAYLDTVAPDQRELQARALVFGMPGVAGAAGLAPLGQSLGTPAGQAYREGRQAFQEGAILDVKDFWASDKKQDDGRTLREAMLADVRKIFAGTLAVPLDLDVDRVRVPLIANSNGRNLLMVPCHMLIPKPGAANFRFEGEVVVETALSSPPPPLSTLRIHSLRCFAVSPERQQGGGARPANGRVYLTAASSPPLVWIQDDELTPGGVRFVRKDSDTRHPCGTTRSPCRSLPPGPFRAAGGVALSW